MNKFSIAELVVIATVTITELVGLTITVKLSLTHIKNVIENRDWNDIPVGTFATTIIMVIVVNIIMLIIYILFLRYIAQSVSITHTNLN